MITSLPPRPSPLKSCLFNMMDKPFSAGAELTVCILTHVVLIVAYKVGIIILPI